MQIHGAMLALHATAVKMVYDRAESFTGHVHRHPARIPASTARRGRAADLRADADPARRRGVRLGSTAVASNAASFAIGPYRVDNALLESTAVYTNNPRAGDARLRGHPDVLRGRGADGPARRRASRSTRSSCGSSTRSSRATAFDRPGRHRVAADPRGDPARRSADPAGSRGAAARPAAPAGGAGNTTRGEGVRRGVGFALGFKNICYSEGFDDFCAARVAPRRRQRDRALGRGGGGAGRRRRRAPGRADGLGTDDVALAPHGTATVGSAGSASASRMTWMAAGAGARRLPGGARGAGARRRRRGGRRARLPPSPHDAARPRDGFRSRASGRTSPSPSRRCGSWWRSTSTSGSRASSGSGRHRTSARRSTPGGRGPDRGRHGAGSRAGADGGARTRDGHVLNASFTDTSCRRPSTCRPSRST